MGDVGEEKCDTEDLPKEECTEFIGSIESVDKSKTPQMTLAPGHDPFQTKQNEHYESCEKYETDKPSEIGESSEFKRDEDDDEGIKEENVQVKVECEDSVDFKAFWCDQCDYRSVSQHGLSNHKKKHMLPFNMNCEDCGQNFRKSGLLFKHSNEQHGGRKCPDCDKRFTGSSPYNLHVKKHTGLMYGCNLCGKEFTSKASLTTHTNIHLGLKPHQCSQCEKAFTDPAAKIRHEKLHAREGNCEAFCPICGKGLARTANLEQHMKTHSRKNFSMDEKVEAVALATRLGVRQASDQLHVGTATLTNWVKMVTEPLYCTQCNYITYKGSKLAQHEKTSHGSELEFTTRMPRDFNLPEYKLRPFPCDLCPVRSKNKEALGKHMRRAHGQDRVMNDMTTHGRYQEKKEHACPSCPKSYSSKYRLSDHMKVCSGSTSILGGNSSDPAFMTEVATFAISSSVLVAARLNAIEQI